MSELIPTKGIESRLAFYIQNYCRDIYESQIPELRGDMPSVVSCKFAIGYDEEVCIARIEFRSAGMNIGGKMDQEEFGNFKNLLEPSMEISDLMAIPEVSSYIGNSKLVLPFPVDNGNVEWDCVT